MDHADETPHHPGDMHGTDFAEQLAHAILTEPSTRPTVLAPRMREPAMTARLDAVARQVSAALGDPFAVVEQDKGSALLLGRTRFGMFYQRDVHGRAERVEIYPLDRPRAVALLRAATVRWFLLAVPLYLSVCIAISPNIRVRAMWSAAVLFGVTAMWTNHRWDLTGVRLRPWWAATALVGPALGWFVAGRWGTTNFDNVDVVCAALTVAASLPTVFAPRRGAAAGLPISSVLAAPVRGYVLQGGASKWLNHHYPHAEQRWALDIVPVTGPLLRQSSLGEVGVAVLAPVDGVVIDAVDAYSDIYHPARAQPPYGNHVVLEHVSGGTATRIYLCHLAEGSVRVHPGQQVGVGDPLGQMGNSGRSTERHLHIHAVAMDGAQSRPAPLWLAGRPAWRGRLLAG